MAAIFGCLHLLPQVRGSSKVELGVFRRTLNNDRSLRLQNSVFKIRVWEQRWRETKSLLCFWISIAKYRRFSECSDANNWSEWECPLHGLPNCEDFIFKQLISAVPITLAGRSNWPLGYVPQGHIRQASANRLWDIWHWERVACSEQRAEPKLEN